MAITWMPKITLLDLETRLISLSATRTDSDNPSNPKTYIVNNMHINTTTEKSAVMKAILTKRAEELVRDAKVAAVADIIADLEVQAKTYLESKEV